VRGFFRTVNRVDRTQPRLRWAQPGAANHCHRPNTSKPQQKRQMGAFPNIEQTFHNIDLAFHNITEPFRNIAKPFPNLTGRSTMLRDHFPILRGHFPILRNRFPILRNHLLILRNHCPILRNGPERLKERFQDCRLPRFGTRTQAETSRIEPARLGRGSGNHIAAFFYLGIRSLARPPATGPARPSSRSRKWLRLFVKRELVFLDSPRAAFIMGV